LVGVADRPTAVVVGAGVIGAATALALARDGWGVTLLERTTPGHAAASSGGESRLLRFSHGANRWYTELAWRARDGWRDVEREYGRQVLAETGLVWFARDADGWEAESQRVLTDVGVPVERLPSDRVADLYPSVRTDDLVFGLWEPHAGVLRAALGTRALAELAVRAGATLWAGADARPDGTAVRMDDRTLHADRIVWACGPWLGPLFPGRLELSVTQQDTCWFAASAAWRADRVPAWVDFVGAAYGTGDLDGHGFKCSTDRQGPPFDPDRDDRLPRPEHLVASRDILAHRFPALAGAPLQGTRTCQYATTIDTGFLIAPLDADHVVWVAGGGSGHAFKHGPALGSYVAEAVAGRRPPDERFGVSARTPAGSLRTAGHRGDGGRAG
jgi:glycine/D-amino acid oxidase-like deaminating enzyme